jgi:hypothetical protein
MSEHNFEPGSAVWARKGHDPDLFESSNHLPEESPDA